MKFPSANEIIEEAARSLPKSDINKLHSVTFQLMKKYRERYYREKVKIFLNRPNIAKSLSSQTELLFTEEMLKPLVVKDKSKSVKYSNFMEEASRRISQTFQVISGNIAELCIEKELRRYGLKAQINYLRRYKRSDFTFFYPNVKTAKKIHRVEVKNVTLRERAIRGLSFDGDSMIGFFNEPSEFSQSTIEIIEEHCVKKGGYCYVPSEIINSISMKLTTKKFKLNTDFAKDMVDFVKTGII